MAITILKKPLVRRVQRSNLVVRITHDGVELRRGGNSRLVLQCTWQQMAQRAECHGPRRKDGVGLTADEWRDPLAALGIVFRSPEEQTDDHDDEAQADA